jgi:predicted ATPase
MRTLPSGTVTFLFTDIEGSTKLLQELGAQAYAQALAEHRRVLREAFAAAGGVEFGTQGDAFFVAFPTAPGAVEAAAAGQRALAAGPIRVRMGIHTGTPRIEEDDYVGEDVHKAARIAASGHGGQVLLSKDTRHLIDVPVSDLGEHRLKDFAEPVWIYQLGTERFPALRTTGNTNLPQPASSFVGRDREVREVSALLEDGARLVTLTGPGGTGKTRLAIEAGTEAIERFKGGVFWIDLASLRDPALVVETCALTLGYKDSLAQHIGEREMLLVLDNFEQVVDAASEMSSLLVACPGLRFLVTSRERLRVQGEVEYPVPPLATDEAVMLFCARAQLGASEEVAELCRRLDSLPLAVELAAARARLLSPKQILDRLSTRLDLFKGGRDSQARQQTLRTTIQWSYELLGEEEKRLFARLAVFAGGCTLEAAEQVADADIETLASLVDKSLVRRTGERFSMLETIHEFANERLGETGEALEYRRRHVAYFVDLGEAAAPHLNGKEQQEWLERLDVELDNVRSAMTYASQTTDGDMLGRFVFAFIRFWTIRGQVREGRAWCHVALERTAGTGRFRRQALASAAWLAHLQGDAEEAGRLATEGLAAAEREGAPEDQIRFLRRLGDAAQERGRYEESVGYYTRSIALARDLHDKESLAASLSNLADLEQTKGAVERARLLYEEALALFREVGQPEGVLINLQMLGLVSLAAGRTADAARYLAESLARARELRDARGVEDALEHLGGVAAQRGRARAGGWLLGAAQRLREESGNALHRMELAAHERTIEALRVALGAEGLAATIAEGRSLTTDAAVEEAFDAARPT